MKDGTMTGGDVWIPHSLPSLGPREEQAVLECVRSGFVGNGAASRNLEEQILARTGRKYAFAVSSGFHALLLSLRAFDLRTGSRVCLPVLTCASVLAAVQNTSHRAVLADIERDTLALDVNRVPSDCDVVIAPHAYGAPVRALEIQRLGLPWIEDCATSPATSVGARPAGASGTIAVFSFASTKYITGGSGGLLVCDDDMLAARVQDLLDFDSFEKTGEWENGWPGALPGRMPDLNASLAKVQLDRIEEFASQRREIARCYNSRLCDVPGLKLPIVTPENSVYRYVVRTKSRSEAISEQLRGFGVDARTSVNPWLNHVPSILGRVEGAPWPVAEALRDHLLSLPIHPSMTKEHVDLVIESLRKTMAAGFKT